jgi:ribonuclease Z
MHSDHTEGLLDVMFLRWYMKGQKIDIVCSSDAPSGQGLSNSCQKYVAHIGDGFWTASAW